MGALRKASLLIKQSHHGKDIIPLFLLNVIMFSCDMWNSGTHFVTMRAHAQGGCQPIFQLEMEEQKERSEPLTSLSHAELTNRGATPTLDILLCGIIKQNHCLNHFWLGFLSLVVKAF